MHAMTGPGTELGKLIPDWLARQKSGCGCQDYQKKMDAWGVDGCKTRRAEIVSRLVSQRRMLPKPLQLLPTAAIQAAAGKLVDQAIKNAEAASD